MCRNKTYLQAAVLFSVMLSEMLGTATDLLITSPQGDAVKALFHLGSVSQLVKWGKKNALFPISQMREPKHRLKRALSPRSQRQSGKVTVTRPSVLVASAIQFTTFFPADAAFLAREKAKADAECYTAMKIAEANKVKAQCLLAKRRYIWV